MQKSDFLYCRDLVRKADYRLYCLLLFLPKQAQEAALILFAFNQELISIYNKSTKDKMTGFMRYQFWRESLDEIVIKKSARQHPVLQSLFYLSQQNFPTLDLHKNITMHESVYEKGSIDNFEDFQDYIAKTKLHLFGTLFQAVDEKIEMDSFGKAYTNWELMKEYCFWQKHPKSLPVLLPLKYRQNNLCEKDVVSYKTLTQDKNKLISILHKSATLKHFQKKPYLLIWRYLYFSILK